MPMFTMNQDNSPSGSPSDAFRKMMVSLGTGGQGVIDPLKLMQATNLGTEAALHMASTQKAQQETSILKQRQADQNDPVLQNRFLANSAGTDEPSATRLGAHLRGIMEQPSSADIQDADLAGQTAQPFVTPAPPSMSQSQVGRYQAALAGLTGMKLATGNTNASELASSAETNQKSAILAAAQDAANRHDVTGVNLLGAGVLGEKEVSPYKTNEHGLVTNQWTGDVPAGPNQNPLLTSSVNNINAEAGQHKASAGEQNALAGLHGTERQVKQLELAGGGAGKAPPGYAWGPKNAQGQPTLLPIEGGPAAGPSAAGTNGATGDEFLSTLPPAAAAQVKALVEGRMAFPTGMALKTPYWQQMLTAAAQYEPGFDATAWKRRNDTATAFSKGKQGDAVRAVNQTVMHAGKLSDAIDKLNNMGGVATLLNAPVNLVEEATGDPSQGTFRQTATALSSEMRKVFSGSGGGSLSELEKWEQSLPQNASKVQQQAYLKNGLELLQGAIGALNDQYQRGMGPSANVMALVSPQARATLQRLEGASPTAPGAPEATKVLNGVTYVKINGQWHSQ